MQIVLLSYVVLEQYRVDMEHGGPAVMVAEGRCSGMQIGDLWDMGWLHADAPLCIGSWCRFLHLVVGLVQH